ncbi:site-2 protease family protein [Gracilibacillus kekensis]|uniref:Sporulation factor SpoIVFB. Metallo peptidase. MEROPS family M50B n=1 Tax=Gracilibacillus kekensis TaxID=1027249 RepID=A0A1M7NXC8_9BACI|nr:site-2 protease family protein [Gracilibacillus kekensis]SHN08769.1 sporulation factor SpoIVFB. Metallo peptidase. MEROPS family M50B [Gracilibacillus kekensis]
MSNLRLPPIHIHPILFFFIFLSIATGMLVELMVIFFIVLIHELGHYSCARYFNWRIRRIFLWVFGGVMETDEYGARPLKEEWLVTIAGPMQHIIIFIFLYVMEYTNLLPDSTIALAYHYNTFILIGNLLPIWPLDGGKLVQLCLDSFFSYQVSHQWMISISLVSIVGVSVLVYLLDWFSLSFCLLMIFFILENRLEWKQRYYKWWRFLWNRYSEVTYFPKVQILEVSTDIRLIDVFRLFKRDTFHQIKMYDKHGNIHLLTEKQCLHNYFENKNVHARMEQLITS